MPCVSRACERLGGRRGKGDIGVITKATSEPQPTYSIKYCDGDAEEGLAQKFVCRLANNGERSRHAEDISRVLAGLP